MENNPDFRPLLEALQTQERLASDVSALRNRNRILGGLITLILLLIGLQGWQIARTNDLAHDTGETSQQTKEIVADLSAVVAIQEAQREQVAEVACRTRNGANRATREQFRLAYNTIAAFDRNDVGLQRSIDRLIASIPKPHEQDRDCNGTGLGADDYPDE